MKKASLIILGVLLLSVSNVSAGDIYAEDVYQFGNFNCSLIELDYDRESKELVFVAIQDANRNESIGLGLLIIKFNLSRAPDFRGVKATINGQPAKDMLKNYTMVEGRFCAMDCIYLEAYFFIFENHTVINERPIEHNISPEIGGFSLASDTDTVGEQVKISIGDYEEQIETETEVQPTSSGIVFAMTVAAVLVGSLIVGFGLKRKRLQPRILSHNESMR